jgi:hypothetical protein
VVSLRISELVYSAANSTGRVCRHSCWYVFNPVVKSNQYAGTLRIERNLFAEDKINFSGFHDAKLCNDISWLQRPRILCPEDGIIRLLRKS